MSKQQTIEPIDDTVKKALADVRAKDHGPCAFVVITYSSPNVLCVKGEGSGGLSEAMEFFDDSEACFALIRKDHKVEMANTIKFALVQWVPNALKPMRRALVSTQKGQIIQILKPFNVDAEISDKSEMSDEQLLKMFGAVSGTSSSVCEKPAEVKVTEPSEPLQESPKIKPSPLPPQTRKTESVQQKFVSGSTVGVAIDDEAGFASLMKQVRATNGEVNWLLLRYGKPFTVAGSGSGGVDELAQSLGDDQPCFGLVRLTELIDNKSKTTKFALIRYVPTTTKPMTKGELNTKKGALDKLFEPFHVDMTIEHASEVTEEIVMDRITTASGSKSHVVAR